MNSKLKEKLGSTAKPSRDERLAELTKILARGYLRLVSQQSSTKMNVRKSA